MPDKTLDELLAPYEPKEEDLARFKPLIEKLTQFVTMPTFGAADYGKPLMCYWDVQDFYADLEWRYMDEGEAFTHYSLFYKYRVAGREGYIDHITVDTITREWCEQHLGPLLK